MVILLNNEYYKNSKNLQDTITTYTFPHNGYEVVFKGVVAGHITVKIKAISKGKKYVVVNHGLFEEDFVINSKKDVDRIFKEVALWKKVD